MLREFPLLALVGPRQSGKTTLARQLLPDRPYVSLEDLDWREQATEDPRGFLRQFPDGAILDEAQRVPALFSYLQGVVDTDGRMGLFVLTGSQNFLLLERVGQSLAGRVGLLHLLPLSAVELERGGWLAASLDEVLWRGGYPAIHSRPADPVRWLNSYLGTYLERDVREVLRVHDAAAFQRFLRLCAGRTGQLLNKSSLANDVGVSNVTVGNWLAILEASGLVYLLRPWHENFRKRQVKSPVLHFLDTGLACRLLGIGSPAQLTAHRMRGLLLESWVVSERLKGRWNAGLDGDCWHWASAGLEVDLLLERAGELQPVEVKSGMTLAPEWIVQAQRFLAVAGGQAAEPLLVYGGEGERDWSGVRVQGWREWGLGQG